MFAPQAEIGKPDASHAPGWTLTNGAAAPARSFRALLA